MVISPNMVMILQALTHPHIFVPQTISQTPFSATGLPGQSEHFRGPCSPHSQCESLSLKTLRKKCKDTMEIQLGCFSNEWLSKENIVVGSTKPTGHRSFHLLMVPYLGWGSPFCTLVRNENAECGSQKMPLGGNLMVGRLVGCPPYGYIYIYISEYIRIIWLFSNMFVYVRQNPGTPGTLKHLLNARLSQKIC